MNEDTPCVNLKTKNLYAICASNPIAKCKEECIPNCKYVGCNSKPENSTDENRETIFDMCIPSKVGEEEITERCSAYLKVNDFQVQDFCMNNSVIVGEFTKTDIIIICIIGFIILCAVLTILYYNVKV